MDSELVTICKGVTEECEFIPYFDKAVDVEVGEYFEPFYKWVQELVNISGPFKILCALLLYLLISLSVTHNAYLKTLKCLTKLGQSSTYMSKLF